MSTLEGAGDRAGGQVSVHRRVVQAITLDRGYDQVDELARHAVAGWAALETEIARSRRHERPFVVLAIPAGGGEDRVEILRHVQDTTRLSDVAWLDGEIVYVLLPESTGDDATAFLRRLRTNAIPDPGESVPMAAFPVDAVTVGGLIEAMASGRSVTGLKADLFL